MVVTVSPQAGIGCDQSIWPVAASKSRKRSSFFGPAYPQMAMSLLPPKSTTVGVRC